MSNVYLCPLHLLLPQEFPKQLEMVGTAADRVRRSTNILVKGKKSGNRLDDQIIVIKDNPRNVILFRKTNLLYFHHLYPSITTHGIDILEILALYYSTTKIL